MQIGFVGLGKMGLNMVTRLVRGGHTVVAFDRSADAVARAEAAGARGVSSLEALVEGADRASRRLGDGARPAIPPSRPSPRSAALLSAGDIDHRRRQHQLSRRCAAGAGAGRQARRTTSTPGRAAASGASTEGYCLMVGGEAEVCRALEPIFLTLAPTDGYLRVGDHGAGHYVKMIHNGDRVRPDAGLRRRLRADARERLPGRSGRGRRALDARQRRAIVAARADRARAGRGPELSTA